MSGPNDPGSDAAPAADFKLPEWDAGQSKIAPGYRLHLHWDVPRLEWRPMKPPGGAAEPALLRLDDPLAAIAAMERYILDGSLLFAMRQPSWLTIDKAFLEAPTLPPTLLPSFAEMKAWEDDAFFRRLGRTPPLFGAPLPPPPLATPPLVPPPAGSPFYKIPDPATARGEPAAPRPGAVGDVLSALYGLPVVQNGLDLVNDEALRQVRMLQAAWGQASWRDRITAIGFATPIAAGAVGTVLGASEARHLAFKSLVGVDVPVPWVPGLKVHVKDYGRADLWLLGAHSPDPKQPQAVNVGATLDLLEAIPALKRAF